MLAIEPDHDFAVLELAASAAGEIGSLAALCQPHDRRHHAHRRRASGRLRLARSGGRGQGRTARTLARRTAGPCWPATTRGCDAWRGTTAANIVWVGRSLDNDLVATDVQSRAGQLELFGRRHADDASACGDGIIWPARWRPWPWAGSSASPTPRSPRAWPTFSRRRCAARSRKVGGATIIDDTYNASPVAMRAALELLRDFDAPGRRIVVCGDMRELGDALEPTAPQLGDQVVTLCGADLLRGLRRSCRTRSWPERARPACRATRAVACRDSNESCRVAGTIAAAGRRGAGQRLARHGDGTAGPSRSRRASADSCRGVNEHNNKTFVSSIDGVEFAGTRHYPPSWVGATTCRNQRLLGRPLRQVLRDGAHD